ncbi:MAG: hypothetical protein K0R76_1307 [Alphaproteobacteria bacterium]|jgi:hypothetical protein|nr:hypothetical protein [Alphaproteobacteria bacterium]
MPDPEDGKVWQAAILKGSGLGLFGDYLFEESCRYGHTFLTEAAGPTAGVASDVFALYTDARKQRLE